MVADVISLFEYSFSKCVEWTSSLFDAVGGGGFLIAAFIIYLVVSLFLVPLRGHAIWDGSDSGMLNDFTKQITYKGKYQTGHRTARPAGTRGKFQRIGKQRNGNRHVGVFKG